MNTIKTILPFPFELIKKSLEDSEVHLSVDARESQLDPKKTIVYLANIKNSVKNFTVDFSQCAFEDKKAFLKEYLNLKADLLLPQLHASLVKSIFALKGVELDEAESAMVDELALFSKAECQNLIEDLPEIGRVAALVDNFPTLIFIKSKAYEELYPHPEEIFFVVDDINYIGHTFTHLIKDELFTYNFFSAYSNTQFTYFKKQFEENAYSGKELFQLFEGSHLKKLAGMLLNGELDINNFAEATQ